MRSLSGPQSFVNELVKNETRPCDERPVRRSRCQVFDGTLGGDIVRFRIARELKRKYPNLPLVTRESLLRRFCGP